MVCAKNLTIFVILMVFCSVVQAEDTQSAWKKLVGRRFAKNPAFAPVEHDAALPSVLVYGDSISIGYTRDVRRALQGQANVYRIHCNGGDSASFISKMERMQKVMTDPMLDDPWKFDWDVIHFNVGLHDLKYVHQGRLDAKRGNQVRSVDDYQKELQGIVTWLKQRWPEATLVFATTTPVPENSQGRSSGDADRYNKAARKVLQEHPEVAVNDLYSLVKPRQREWWTKPGNVHFKSAGSAALGQQVAESIRAALQSNGQQEAGF